MGSFSSKETERKQRPSFCSFNMKTAAFIIGLVFIFCEFTEKTTAEGQLRDFAETVQSECRDRYLWIHVASGKTPHFEAVDENGIHSISEQLASHCGYTISSFKMDGSTTFRASYYSCFTHNQNDEVFTFRFNVIVSNADGRWISRPVSAVCSGLIWTHREIICEDDYMEVNVNRESSCGGQWGDSEQMRQAAFSQAQRMASSVWQLMILQSDGQVSSMSISEAQRQGYNLTTTSQRVVLRSQYKQPNAELTMVDGIPVEVIRASLFFKQKLMVVMIDVSMACTVNSGSFDGARLLWDIPLVMTPLVGEGVGFESQSLSLGVEGVLLDEPTATTRGFSLVQQGNQVQIGVPFGAEGGYRKSLVENNVYKEMYVIFLLYEHVFSLLYEDGSRIDTRHRLLRVLDTPLLCRPPFSLDQTVSDDQVFSIYLGNIPADVQLEEVRINGKQLMSEIAERGYTISSVVNINGSHAYKLQLPFEDAVVHWTYLGQGVVEFSIDLNFTLTIIPQRDSYYHHTFITAQVFNTFPPEITAQCSDRGITFIVVKPPRAESLWEVGIDHEPLTSQLAAKRGYLLHNDTHRTSMEVPVFSIGYTYEGINLSNFYGSFKLLLRDSKTLDVQTSTYKRCLFKTQDMIVCSGDGTMTVVTTLASTWPTVQPDRTSLLDRTCGPKQTNGSRVLFEFKLDSCGTRTMAGESYMVYENEILHDREMVADGPNFISRESQFKLTVRCFYPLSGVNSLSVDQIFRSETPGFGSVLKSLEDSTNKLHAQDCFHQVSGNAVNTLSNQVHQRPLSNPGPSHFITVPGGHNKLLYSSQNSQSFPNRSPSPESLTIGTPQIPLKVSSPSGHLMSQTQKQDVFGSQNDEQLSNFPHRYDQLSDNSVQLSNINTPTLNFGEVRHENVGLTDDNPVLSFSTSSRISDSPVVEQFKSGWGSSSQTQTLKSPNSLGDTVQHWDQPTLGQNGINKPNQDLQRLKINLSPSMQELTQQHEAKLDLSLYRSSSGGVEMANTKEIPGYQPRSQYDPSQTSQLHPALQLAAQYSPDYTGHSEVLLPGRDNKYNPNTKRITSTKTVPHLSGETRRSVSIEPTSAVTSQVEQNLERPGSIERRNINTVQNIRVKPLSIFVSSRHTLNQKPVIQQAKTQITNSSQHATSLTAVSSDGNYWTYQQLPEHRGSNVGEKHVPNKTGFSKPKQKQVVHSVRVKSDRSAVLHLFDLAPNQPEHQQNVLLPSGAANIRIRPVSSLQGRHKTRDQPKLQNLQDKTTPVDTREGTSRMSYPSVTPQNIPNTPFNIRDYQLNTLNSNKDLNPTARGAGFTGSHTGSTSTGGSVLKIHTRSDCSGQYGTSVHQGIIRGKLIS